jgi:hypothetical protein
VEAALGISFSAENKPELFNFEYHRLRFDILEGANSSSNTLVMGRERHGNFKLLFYIPIGDSVVYIYLYLLTLLWFLFPFSSQREHVVTISQFSSFSPFALVQTP